MLQLLLKCRFCTIQKKVLFTTSERPEAYEHIFDPMLDLMAKGFRKQYIDRQVIDFRKVIIPAKRIRTLDDHIENLTKQKEVPVVIEGREEFEDIDLVFDYFQLAAVKRRVCANAAPVYVKVGDNKEIRCTLGEILKDQRNDWPFKVKLRRYIIGRPNLLYIPLSIEENFKNASANRGTAINSHLHGVWVYSYNPTYPTRFVVDPANIQPSRPYKLGDLQNTFPQGVLLHERYKKMIHMNIATIDQDEEEKFFKQAEFQRQKREDDTEIITTATDMGEETIEGDVYYAKKEKTAPKKEKKRRERSLKKIVKQANQELIKEVQRKDAEQQKS